MKLIISEKAIAGERIASFLADGDVKQINVAGARTFQFNYKGEEIILVPLRGHISDVEFPKEYSNWMKTDFKKLASAKVLYSKKEYRIIDGIKAVAPDAKEMIIATDADREGEAIGLEAINYAKQTNKNVKITRAYFSAITKEDMDKSFNELEEFDYNFAHSADARREIDLIWGAVLTRVISITSGQLGKSFLSVGRVQTPTLALVVNREKERMAFLKKKYWEIVAHCKKDKVFLAQHKTEKFFEKEKAQSVIDKDIKELIVKKVDKKTKTLKKPTPFNTTEFLRAAASIKLSVGKAMSTAESLYQKGFVSYPRTDNKAYPKTIDLKAILKKLVTVEELAKDTKKVLDQEKIVPSKGKETKDHPPIYPVAPVKKSALSPDEWKVYELIARRFLATLYVDAKTENVGVYFEGKEEEFISRGQVILDAGWKAIYYYSKLSEVFLPNLNVGDKVDVTKIDMVEKETQPPGRYSEGSLIKLMEKNNLGTKSTRPAIIQKLFFRNYIKGSKSIEASTVAIAVISSLEKHCEVVTKPEMTAGLEKEMDEIAAGNKNLEGVVSDSVKKLHEVIDTLLEHRSELALEIKKSISTNNVIGKCNKCESGDLISRKGKSGKRFVGCNSYPACTNSFPLPQKGTIITTKELCAVCGVPVIRVKNKGREYKMCIDMNCKTKDSWRKKASIVKTKKK
ncbi:MAG: DNA topoisomerase I [Candidatus Diapherotrites archaeon]|jgi:DNA topoisomerase I|uniref:DNA topoisomerase 1 n=1 Tax=Candidatus Iainarchaeum sp. TaxID=3101447 RepID=A0A8T5GF75_9ARCH|nr:DNA topoisomerase I [Candidatus Diapherotrites archaeon]MBT7241001.1 DNA topoisomerase I [Candidatus Diapherotrites archaeon]